MISNVLAFGAHDYVKASDILLGNSKINLVLISELFDKWHDRNFENPVGGNIDGAEESKLEDAK